MSTKRYISFAKSFAVILFGIIALHTGSARADGHEASALDALFQRGNDAYLKGDYQAAIDAYERVLAGGVNHEDLHYNLANAYVQADRLGPAILHYELALALDPTQEDARANLDLVRHMAANRFQDKLLGERADPFWVRGLAMFALAIAAWLLPAGFVRVAVLATLVFAFVGAVGTGGLLAGRWYLATRVEQAIVLPDELSVKEGPDANYQTSFLVHAGLKIRIVEHDGDWVRVRLSNGLEGWTRDRDVGRL
jgi:tetratricopeptide (TPR) repeat protein